MQVRLSVADAYCAFSRAVTVATRYSTVCRQFGSQNGGPETTVKLLLFTFICNIKYVCSTTALDMIFFIFCEGLELINS